MSLLSALSYARGFEVLGSQSTVLALTLGSLTLVSYVVAQKLATNN